MIYLLEQSRLTECSKLMKYATVGSKIIPRHRSRGTGRKEPGDCKKKVRGSTISIPVTYRLVDKQR